MAKRTIVFPLREREGRLLKIASLVLSFAMVCVLFLGAFIGFQPDQFSLSDRYFPSSTATTTGTPTPTLTTTLTPTMTLTATPTRTLAATNTPTVTATFTPNLATEKAAKEAFETTAVAAHQNWRLIFSEGFDDNQKQWPMGTRDDDSKEITYEITTGRYGLNVKAHTKFSGSVDILTSSIGNFTFSAEARQVRGAPRTDYGLIFRKDEKGNFYYFGINDIRQYTLRRFYNNEWSELISWTSSEAIVSGELNRLEVIAEDDHFMLFINNQFIAEAHDGFIEKGTFALAFELYAAGHLAVLEFDNVELHAP